MVMLYLMVYFFSFFFIYFINLFLFNWRIIDLQYCVGFCLFFKRL